MTDIDASHIYCGAFSENLSALVHTVYTERKSTVILLAYPANQPRKYKYAFSFSATTVVLWHHLSRGQDCALSMAYCNAIPVELRVTKKIRPKVNTYFFVYVFLGQ
jgi:hypothetical protein